jgi:hypothetical protein
MFVTDRPATVSRSRHGAERPQRGERNRKENETGEKINRGAESRKTNKEQWNRGRK